MIMLVDGAGEGGRARGWWSALYDTFRTAGLAGQVFGDT